MVSTFRAAWFSNFRGIMRLHRHLVYAVIQCLQDSFSGKYYADKVLEYAFRKNKKWGARDRKFVAENFYEMVRYWKYLWAVLGKEESLEQEDLLELFAVHCISKEFELPDWEEFEAVNKKQIQSSLKKDYPLDVKESVPNWIDDLGQKEFGQDWRQILPALNQPASVVLRTNRLKTSPEKLCKILMDENIQSELNAEYPDALVLKERANVFKTNAFKEGLFEVQDAASQTVAPMLNPQAGERVIDACAGAGGKSLHLAALMNNKGKVISMDIHEHKLQELKKRSRRAGVSIIETRPISNSKVIKRLHDSADALLLDVPCSGLGVLRRNPDTKWKLKESDLNNIWELQKDIITRYSKMVKKGGRMVYATCSILPSENEKQVEAFLAENPEWELDHYLRHWAHKEGFDGFFAALLIRKD